MVNSKTHKKPVNNSPWIKPIYKPQNIISRNR